MTGLLGRLTAQGQVITRPHADGARLGWAQRDEVVEILRYIVGKGWFPHNHVWVETERGFIYSSVVQPVKVLLNQPESSIPEGGLWAEVSVPFTEGRKLAGPTAEVLYRLYYSMVVPISSVLVGDDGQSWYLISDENGTRMFAPASDLRPIRQDEVIPISPDVEAKAITVDLTRQRLQAFEGQTEVFTARVASGLEFFGLDGQAAGGLTHPGTYPIWGKRVSRHMLGGTREDGYDLPGVGWVSYFAGSGAAIHSTYWHNDFGQPKSHGCLNVAPGDAYWLFRWTLPQVSYHPGDVTVEWPGGTQIVIKG